MPAPIEVSVLCITYNHGDMLRQSLDSMLGQKTDFGFEIIVHDDCSTDNTTAILRKYAEMYPDIIIPVYEQVNQYYSGRKIVREMAADLAKGKYIAFCEGDDYWLDYMKLQSQYEALETHTAVDLCAGRGVVIDATTGKRIGWMRPKQQDCLISVQDIITGGGQYLATASLFMRRHILAEMPYAFEKEMEIDYAWQIKGALRGGVCYLDKEMVAYRSGVEGAWSTRMTKDVEMRKEHVRRMTHMLETLDRETAYQYHEQIQQRIGMSQRGDISFFDQLDKQKQDVIALFPDDAEIYLWGNGKRGLAFQKFCQENDIYLSGVCDAIEESIGEMTPLGFPIVSTETVKSSRGIIVASNKHIYDDLQRSSKSLNVVNLQKYIPYE